MKREEITRVINLIKKCKKQPIILQILISHMQFLTLNANELFLKDFTTDIEILVVSCCVKTKKPNSSYEKVILNYLIENRKKCCNLKFRLILFYLLNQDTNKTNFFILNELIHNFVFKNTINDFLVVKYLTKMVTANYFELFIKNRIQTDVFRAFLLQLKNKTLCPSVWSALLPLYINTQIDPPICPDLKVDFFSLKYLESVYVYCTYEKDKQRINSKVLNSNTINESLIKYLNKTDLQYESVTSNCSLSYIFINTSPLFDDIRFQYNESSDKQRFLKNLFQVYTQLKEKHENKD